MVSYICFSGNFAYEGQKPAVERTLLNVARLLIRMEIVDSNVKKSTDYLIIGSYACQAYSNGAYGTKVKKAIEYSEKGGNVQIMKETDFFVNMK